MRNVMAIAGRELRSYFASPIAYVVIGFFALVFGWMYVGVMTWFVQQGTQMGMGMGPQNLNVNQQMIRPLLLNMTVVFLFAAAAHHDADVLGGEALRHDGAAADVADYRPRDHPRASSSGRSPSTRVMLGVTRDPLRPALLVRQTRMEAAG